MKLKLVGTGAIGAFERSASSLVDDIILVDCGNGITKTVVQEGGKIEELEAMLITHLHGDHYADLPFFLMKRFYSKAEKRINIYCPIGTEDRVKALMRLFFGEDCLRTYDEKKKDGNVNFIEFSKLDDEEICPGYFVTSYEMEHGDCRPAYGFILKHDEKKIGFSGDSSLCENVRSIVKESNSCVLDMTDIEGNGAHMGYDNIKTLHEEYKECRIIPTHMKDKTRTYVKSNMIESVIVPNDGDTFEI